MKEGKKDGAFYTILGVLGVLAICILLFSVSTLLFSSNNPFDAFQSIFIRTK
jgi:hypothetical protein